MKNTLKRITAGIVCTVLAAGLSLPVRAASVPAEQETAAAYLQDQGLLSGDQNGNLHLDESLTRAQLAVLVSQLSINPEHIAWERDLYASLCPFEDVPEWAKTYVGVCTAHGLMSGYENGRFGPSDLVTPQMACTVILRYLEQEGWNYSTACGKALELGLAPSKALESSAITRGDMAVMIYRALGNTAPTAEADPKASGLTYNADGSINVPADGSKYVPQKGDVVRCDDGTNYTITDVSRYDNNVFAEGPVGELPSPTCDWSVFPELALPEAEVRHFTNNGTDSLFIRNLYETRRMQYTLYNALATEPGAWKDGKPLASVHLTIPADKEVFTGAFWPWRASEVEKHVHNRPNSRYYVEAWDFYSKGVFQYTRYCILSL